MVNAIHLIYQLRASAQSFESNMPGSVNGGYFPRYPHHDGLDPEIRTFITNFYHASDRPESNELWISYFTKDAQVTMGSDVGKGEQG